MATTKIVLRKKPNKDKTYPLAIRITKDRKSSFIHLGYSLFESQWDAKNQLVKKSHPNSARLNNLIRKKLADATDKALDLEVDKTDTSSRAIRNTIKGSKQATFFAQASVYTANLQKEGKFNRLSAEEPRIERFREFLKEYDIPFREIDVPLLNKYRAYLKATRKITERTVVNHLIVIRTIFNQAIKGNIVNPKYYPFGKNKIVIKFPDSLKIGGTVDEVASLERLQLDDPFLNHARNLWLFSFYFAGMRASDVLRLQWSDFENDRLYYAMGKNLKAGSLRIPSKAQTILNHYKNQQDETNLVFPELKKLDSLNDRFEVERKIKSKLRRINEALAEIKKMIGITKPLTMHISRHTFGNISGETISPQMLQKLYRHTSITTTIAYQGNFIHKDADDALNSVINI
jgi:integrase/recombinase XerD